MNNAPLNRARSYLSSCAAAQSSWLKGGVVERARDDAAAFVRSFRDPHLPKSSAAVLLSIEEANDKNRGRADQGRLYTHAELATEIARTRSLIAALESGNA
jgi:hypothetical protein